MADLKSGEGVENEVGMGQKYVFNTTVKLENDANYALLLRTAAKRNVSIGTVPTDETLMEYDVELIGTKPNIRRLISRFAQWFNVEKEETTNEDSYVKYKPRYYYVHEVEIDLAKLPTRVFEQMFKAGIIIKEYNMETMVARLAGVKQEVLKITRLFFDHKVVAKDVIRVKESNSDKLIALRKLSRLAGLNESVCQRYIREMDDDYDDMRDNTYKAPLDENDEDYEDNEPIVSYEVAEDDLRHLYDMICEKLNTEFVDRSNIRAIEDRYNDIISKIIDFVSESA